MGVGDRRTTQAKESKTVNFDVVKNEPEAYTRPQEEIKTEAPAETVDFNFDQPEE